jgi:hypothetical protein
MGEWLLSRRDSMIVARHEVPGKRPSKEPSRRVRFDRAPLIQQLFLVENVRRVALGRLNTLLKRFVSDDVRAAAPSNGPCLRETDAEYAIVRCQAKFRRFGNL